MKFELKPPGVQFSDEELLDDLRRVATITGKTFVTKTDYKTHGRYGRRTFSDRFGSWSAAHKLAGLTPFEKEVSRELLLPDLKKVSEQIGKSSVSQTEYQNFGRWSTKPFIRVFGSWHQALAAAGLETDPQFKQRIDDDSLFKNLETVWTNLGRQPRYIEFQRPLTKIARGTYCTRFGGWRKALEAFVEWVNSDGDQIEPDPTSAGPECEQTSKDTFSPTPVVKSVRRTPREINLRLRFRVFQRDNFTCKGCGRSPATVLGLILHVDHVVPWSAGGETTMGNLQTLCEPCNLGKGDILPQRSEA